MPRSHKPLSNWFSERRTFYNVACYRCWKCTAFSANPFRYKWGCVFFSHIIFPTFKIKVITNTPARSYLPCSYLLPNRRRFCTYSSHSVLILVIGIYSHQGLAGIGVCPSMNQVRGRNTPGAGHQSIHPLHPSSPHTGTQYSLKSLRPFQSAWCACVWLWEETGEPVENMRTPQRHSPSPQSFPEPPFSRRVGEIELARTVAQKWPLLFIRCSVSQF